MPIVQNVQNALKEQLAVCEKVATFKTSKGQKEVYTLKLNDGQPSFEVWESQYFKASKGDTFRPVLSVIPSAYTNKDGKAYANMKPVINWEKVSLEVK